MIGIVIPGPEGEEGAYRVMEHTQSYMGRLEPGDRVIQVRKFEPTQLGSNLFRLTQKEFPVFIEDVRLILDNRDLVSDGTPQRRISARAARQGPLTSNQLVGGYDPLLTYRLSSHSKEAVRKLAPAKTRRRLLFESLAPSLLRFLSGSCDKTGLVSFELPGK